MPQFSHFRAGAALLCATVIALASAGARAQQVGPDIIVGSLHDLENDGSVGSVAAFAVGTTSCNIGDMPVTWEATTNQHPVIAQNMYRVANGRIEQIGMSWLKHGFFALSGILCDTGCQGDPTGTTLGVGCSDPYSASTNGTQGALGPRSDVNPVTGFFNYPPPNPPWSGPVDRRLQVAHADLDPALNPNARYFVEGHYIHPEDAMWGNDDNNASFREIDVAGAGAGPYFIAYTPGSVTIRAQPAIMAWGAVEQDVTYQTVDIPGDGRVIIAFKMTDLGGGMRHYEYAIQNFNSKRAIGSVAISLPLTATVQNVGFHDVPYHSGEPYDGTDWTSSFNFGQLVWSTTNHAIDPNANALRWGTTYNFWFDSDAYPAETTLGIFEPGTPATLTVDSPLPAFTVGYPNGIPASIPPNTAVDVDVQTTNLWGAPDPTTAQLFYSVDGGPYTAVPLTHLSGPNFRATLPASPWFAHLDWYVSIDPVVGQTVLSPEDAPRTVNSTVADQGGVVAIFADDFEADLGWTTASMSAFAGFWERAVPFGGATAGDPPSDFDGSGNCYVTQNQPNKDVDFGTVLLTSPVFDLSLHPDARFVVATWFDNASGDFPNEDFFEIEITNDGGATWSNVVLTSESQNGWLVRSHRIGAYVTPTSQVQIRFVTSDLIHDSTVEAGVDAFRIEVPASSGLLLPCAAGTVGTGAGGPYDVLTINGSSGGPLRRVDVVTNTALTFGVAQPPTNPQPAGFLIFGSIGIPTPADVTTLPFGLGETCIRLCALEPANPTLFALADSFGVSPCPPFLPATATAWTAMTPPIPIEFDAAFQGIVSDPTQPFFIGITNGVLLRIRAP